MMGLGMMVQERSKQKRGEQGARWGIQASPAGREGSGIAEEEQVEVYKPEPAGLCHCADEGRREAVKATPSPGPEHAQADPHA